MFGLLSRLILIVTTASLVFGQSSDNSSTSTTSNSNAYSGVSTNMPSPGPEIIKPVGALDSLLNQTAGAPVVPIQAIVDRVITPEVILPPAGPLSTSSNPSSSTNSTSDSPSRSRWRNHANPDQMPDRANPTFSVGREDALKINPVVDPAAPQVKPMVMSSDLPPAAAATMDALPDDVKTLKTMVATRDEAIRSLNAAMSQLRDNCDKPGPIGIMPPPLGPPPTVDMGCAMIVRAKEDEIQRLKKRVTFLENAGKQQKRQIDVYVQKMKPATKTKGKIKSSTSKSSNADCDSALDYEKTVTSALQQGVVERDVQITNLQESLKNAEDRVTVVQNREINACNLKMRRVEMDLQKCKDGVELRNKEKYSSGDSSDDSDDDEDSYDEDYEDDSEDPGIRSIVYKLLISSAIQNRHPFIYFNGFPTKFNRRFENRAPVITLGDNEYYFQNSSRASWKVANNNCEKRKMRLVSIENEEENAMIAAIVGNSTFNYWTSGRDTNGRGSFQWSSTRKQFDNYTNWAPDQQQNGDSRRQCVSTGPGSDGFYWRVEDCNTALYYVCEKAASNSG